VDQLLDWEDLLDFIQRAQQNAKKFKQDQPMTRSSPSVIPTIPVGISSSTISSKKMEVKKADVTPTKPVKKRMDNKEH
jgi:hypothetical protein